MEIKYNPKVTNNQRQFAGGYLNHRVLFSMIKHF